VDGGANNARSFPTLCTVLPSPVVYVNNPDTLLVSESSRLADKQIAVCVVCSAFTLRDVVRLHRREEEKYVAGIIIGTQLCMQTFK
jgi:hypothetical protein